MLKKYLAYVGIDVQAHQKPFFYTVLDSTLEVIATGHGRMVDVLSYLAGLSSALVAVNGPISAREPDREVKQSGLFDQASPAGELVTARTGEKELASRGFTNFITGKTEERSIALASGLRELGYTMHGEINSDKVYLETNCDAACWLAAGCLPYDARSLEGRLQRQLILCEMGIHLKDPMNFLEEFTRHRLRTSQLPMEQILPGYELRAMMAAATAWLVDSFPEKVEHLGKSGAGEVILAGDFSSK
ncbi:MAG: hypothetical protein GYA15_03630 [Leptolinea sp.]|jgi:hypothetical protein|nr:hypothetical protein [Leptolinea sp.]